MKMTKQTAYSWEAGNNQTAEATATFATQLLALCGSTALSVVAHDQDKNIIVSPKTIETSGDWRRAFRYCEHLNELCAFGKTNWRLPTTDELKQIIAKNNDLHEVIYWSSDEAADDRALGVIMNVIMNGATIVKQKSELHFIRPVCDINA